MRRVGSRLLAVALAAALLGGAAPALADPPTRSIIPPGGTRFREGHPQNQVQRGQDGPRFHGRATTPRRDGRHDHHVKTFRGHNVIVLPSPVVVFPGRCWTQGYWAYQWVPQATPYQVWVAGHWSAGGTWVPGHYQIHYHTSGYYQPYWVEGYWSGC